NDVEPRKNGNLTQQALSCLVNWTETFPKSSGWINEKTVHFQLQMDGFNLSSQHPQPNLKVDPIQYRPLPEFDTLPHGFKVLKNREVTIKGRHLNPRLEYRFTINNTFPCSTTPTN